TEPPHVSFCCHVRVPYRYRVNGACRWGGRKTLQPPCGMLEFRLIVRPRTPSGDQSVIWLGHHASPDNLSGDRQCDTGSKTLCSIPIGGGASQPEEVGGGEGGELRGRG